ncbi:MAG: FKBP-type peptidyl-prolyl cis-trans isomerase N-terminal domain-containing protein, partial [Treponema sp.]|nr:FKBP-type peptidyl-prolyl cis-trans isomerase N-terminal domain-containing protein [Treponema sp.]
MRKLFCIILFLAVAIVFCAALDNEKADVSYAFGMLVASDLAATGLEFDYDAFIRGFREIMEHEETRYTLDESMDKIDSVFIAAHAETAEQNRILGA